MKIFERIGLGLAVLSVGITLFVGLPPPWWPDMPAALVHAGVSLGVVLIVTGLFLIIAASIRKQRSRMLPIVGMIISGVLFIGFAAWHFWPSASTSGNAENEASAIAHLTELGWTVVPDPDGYRFQIENKALPEMDQSLVYFRQISRPFSFRFQAVNNLNGLHYLANNEHFVKIEISAGEFTDISELNGFSKLNTLIISQVPLNGNDIVDPSVLSSLVIIENLGLNMTKIRTLDFVSSLKKLKNLNLGGTFVSNVAPLAGLSLETLDIRGTKISDLSPLGSNQNLKELSIGAVQLTNLDALSSLRDLKKLSIIDQQYIDITNVGKLSNLRSLFIWGAGRIDISPLRNLLKLEELHISGMGLGAATSVPGYDSIGDLSELKSLTLGYLQITDIAFASKLTSLSEINLNTIPIQSIEPLRRLGSLKKISLISVPIADISPLLDLSNLTDLTVGRTPARADILAEMGRRGVKITSF